MFRFAIYEYTDHHLLQQIQQQLALAVCTSYEYTMQLFHDRDDMNNDDILWGQGCYKK
jgi:hypothetical protein